MCNCNCKRIWNWIVSILIYIDKYVELERCIFQSKQHYILEAAHSIQMIDWLKEEENG